MRSIIGVVLSVYRSLSSDCFSSTYPVDTCTSGTSFAAPIVSGLVARYLEGKSPSSSTWSAVRTFLTNQSVTTISAPTSRPLVRIVDCN